FKADAVKGCARIETFGAWIKYQTGSPRNGIEALIGKVYSIFLFPVFIQASAPQARNAAHLEQIGKIGIEEQCQAHIDIAAAIIFQRQPMIGRAIAEKNMTDNMNDVLLLDKLLVGVKVRIGEID